MQNKREAEEQAALFEWAQWQTGKFPELALMFHIPNGGSRHAAEAANLKRQGVKAGVPDICLPIARGGCHSMYIELKTERGKPSEKQLVWLDSLRRQGHCAVICHGCAEAAEEILKYLKSEDDNE